MYPIEIKIVNISGGTSNRKLKLSVAGASNLSARVQKLIARKLRADDILIATHASDACVAQGWPKCPNLHQISRNKMVFPKSPCQMRITPFSSAPILNATGQRMCVWHVPAMPRHNYASNRAP